MTKEHTQEIFSDDSFLESLLLCESIEKSQLMLEEKGLKLSLDDLREIRDAILANMRNELSINALDDIAGGNMKEIFAIVQRYFQMKKPDA